MDNLESFLAPIEERFRAARQTISDLCDGTRRWVMSVPARPEHDADLILSDSSRDVPRMAQRLRRQEIRLAASEAALADLGEKLARVRRVACGEDQLEDQEAMDDTDTLGWIYRFLAPADPAKERAS